MSDHQRVQSPARVLAGRAALFASIHSVINERTNLREAVCAYMAAEQASGSTVASVVQAVQETLREATEGAAAADAELAQQLVDSCLEPYT